MWRKYTAQCPLVIVPMALIIYVLEIEIMIMKVVVKVFFVIIILIVCYSIIVYIRAKIWEKQIGNIASEMIVDIANPWSTTNILKHASVALKASPYEGIDLRQKAASQLLGSARKVAELPDCNITKGKDTYSNHEYVYASCIMRVVFEKRTSDLFIRLVSQDNQWVIDDFYIKQ
jgi:hypothetical protein